MAVRLTLAAALVALALPPPARADAACAPGRAVRVDGLGTPADDLLRLAQLAGAAPLAPDLVRRGGLREARLCEGGDDFAWAARLPGAPEGPAALAAVPARVTAAFASRHPEAANDGLLWQGRGFGALASGGVALRAGPLTAALAPEVTWSQNAWFETVPTGHGGDLAFASPWYGADYDGPQRFGAGPVARVHPGQSFVRLDAFGVGAGLSTESVWLGPGLRSAIVLTNAGPGLPHAFVGTSAPVDIGVGRLEALALWGRVDRSRYDREQGAQAFTALALDWEPSFAPGLYLGAVRAFVETPKSLRDDRGLTVLEPPWKPAVPRGDNPQDNQLAALWLRWVVPEAGLELYGEWGKDDFPASLGALLRETSKRQAWVLGAQKLLRSRGRWVRLQAELASTYDGGGDVADEDAFYTHYGGRLGWTNGGQPLGMYAGPGGSLAFAAVDLLGASGRVGLFVERLERNADVFYGTIARQPDRGTDRDTEVALGLRGARLLGRLEVSWEAAATYRWNRDFLRNEGGARASIGLALPAALPAAPQR